MSLSDHLKLPQRHKWFSSPWRNCEENWFGPFDKFEDAIIAAVAEGDGCHVYVCQGRKLLKREREEEGAEYTWEVDPRDAIEVRLPEHWRTGNE